MHENLGSLVPRPLPYFILQLFLHNCVMPLAEWPGNKSRVWGYAPPLSFPDCWALQIVLQPHSAHWQGGGHQGHSARGILFVTITLYYTQDVSYSYSVFESYMPIVAMTSHINVFLALCALLIHHLLYLYTLAFDISRNYETAGSESLCTCKSISMFILIWDELEYGTVLYLSLKIHRYCHYSNRTLDPI